METGGPGVQGLPRQLEPLFKNTNKKKICKRFIILFQAESSKDRINSGTLFLLFKKKFFKCNSVNVSMVVYYLCFKK